MKNLFERLKPEVQERIYVELVTYPEITKSLIDRLKKLDFVIHIQYGDVLTLAGLVHLSDLYKFWDLFED